jgi:hypothetical protein
VDVDCVLDESSLRLAPTVCDEKNMSIIRYCECNHAEFGWRESMLAWTEDEGHLTAGCDDALTEIMIPSGRPNY